MDTFFLFSFVVVVVVVVVKMDKIEKELIYGRKKWGSPSIEESKLQAKLAHPVSACVANVCYAGSAPGPKPYARLMYGVT